MHLNIDLRLKWSSIENAKEEDESDPCREFRERFFIPSGNKLNHHKIYLCGHSLGLQPRLVPEMLQQALLAWQNLASCGHFQSLNKDALGMEGTCSQQAESALQHGSLSVLPAWMHMDDLCARLMAKLIGANEDEVAVMNGLSVNLNLLLNEFYKPTRDRFKILVEDQAFISDRDALHAHAIAHGHAPSEALGLIPF